MHELSIAAAIADVALRHARGRTVRRVEVRVGHLRQVVPSALQFSWQLVCRDTELAGSELLIEDVPARGTCRSCGRDGRLAAFPLGCDGCGSFEVDVEAGLELLVEALELDDEATGPEDPPRRTSGAAFLRAGKEQRHE